ncbi:helix-turn-helix transcriptional regulator [Pseudoalteromonas sp. ZZD1]|uniref:helix-turn-helix transcriptional regulator n=1 Tax=Pseudoalteromonas sp. ZZD1 TaxID=3139395 RepID=UPI003BAA26C4
MNVNTDLIGVISAPTGAASLVKRKLNKKGINSSAAAHRLGVNPSTLSRFFNGSDLSISLAAKLSHHFDFDVETLFNLEAQKKVHAARKLNID